MAIHDSVTGLLYSLSALREWLTHEFNRAERYGSPFTLVRMDLPQLGGMDHGGRKIAFSSIAKIVKDNVRQTDLCGRSGRTRLYILMTGTGLAEARLIADRLRDKIQALQFLDKQQRNFSPGCESAFIEYQKNLTNLDKLMEFLND